MSRSLFSRKRLYGSFTYWGRLQKNAKAGVNRRIYKTFQHQVAQMNSIIDEQWKTPADTTGR